MDDVVDDFDCAFKDAADNTLLLPHVAFFQFSISKQTCQLRARTRAARRAVVSLTRTEHKVFTVDSRQLRWSEELHVIDLVPVRPGNSGVRKGFASSRSKLQQAIDIVEFQLLAMFVYEEKP